MLTIKILGSGCPNCERLELHARKAAEGLLEDKPGLEITIEKVTSPERFLEYGLLNTPGLVVNEHLASSGRIPSPSQIQDLIEAELAGAEG